MAELGGVANLISGMLQGYMQGKQFQQGQAEAEQKKSLTDMQIEHMKATVKQAETKLRLDEEQEKRLQETAKTDATYKQGLAALIARMMPGGVPGGGGLPVASPPAAPSGPFDLSPRDFSPMGGGPAPSLNLGVPSHAGVPSPRVGLSMDEKGPRVTLEERNGTMRDFAGPEGKVYTGYFVDGKLVPGTESIAAKQPDAKPRVTWKSKYGHVWSAETKDGKNPLPATWRMDEEAPDIKAKEATTAGTREWFEPAPMATPPGYKAESAPPMPRPGASPPTVGTPPALGGRGRRGERTVELPPQLAPMDATKAKQYVHPKTGERAREGWTPDQATARGFRLETDADSGKDPTTAAKIAQAQGGAKTIAAFRNLVMPGGKLDSGVVFFIRHPTAARAVVAGKRAIPGVPYDSGTAQRAIGAEKLIYDLTDLRLRATSGAAVTPSEMEITREMVAPEWLNTEEQAAGILSRFATWAEVYEKTLSPYGPNKSTGEAGKSDPLGIR